MDRGQERGRGLLPRVQSHQAAPAPVQRPPEGRQVVPVPRRHARRGMATGDGHAGRKAQGRSLLRALRTRVRHPGDARPAPADVSHPHVHAGEVRSSPPTRTAVSLRAHREVRGAVRRSRAARGVRPARRRPARVPRRRSLARPRPSRQADARRRRLARVRARGTLARPDHVGAQGHRTSADGRPQGGGLRLHRPRRGCARGVGAGVLRAEGPGRRSEGPRGRQGRGPRTGRARRSHSRAALRRRPGDRRAPRGPRPGAARRRRALRGVPDHGTRVTGARARAATGCEASAARAR